MGYMANVVLMSREIYCDTMCNVGKISVPNGTTTLQRHAGTVKKKGLAVLNYLTHKTYDGMNRSTT